MPPDPITEGLLRHYSQHAKDGAIRELARDVLAGRISLHQAAKSSAYVEPLAAQTDLAKANLQAAASPSPPVSDDDDWDGRSVFG
jgi:hypothetical protein